MWYGIQGSFLQLVALHVAPLLKHADLLSVYHAGLFADEMILLTGTWLVASRFFEPPAAFFVTVSVVGSCVWLDQPYWNFRLYYAIPLVLESGHRFLDTGRWRWFLCTANLLALQTIGNLPYFIPIASFSVFAYFTWYTAANHHVVWGRVRALRWGASAGVAIVLAAMSFVVAYECITIGTEELVGYNVGRTVDGTTSLVGFLTFGGLTNADKWLELVLRVSPWLDNTLYAGMLISPLVLCGVVSADRRRIHFVLLAGTLALFTLATPVSTALFFAWPGMKYFRHIGLVSSFVKVLLCFVAGIGFERLFELQNSRQDARRLVLAALSGVLLVYGGWFAFRLSRSDQGIERYVDSLSVARVLRAPHVNSRTAVADRLRLSATLAWSGAAIVGLVPLALSVPLIGGSPRSRKAVIHAVLALVAADVYSYKAVYLFDRSDEVRRAQRFVVRASMAAYAERRALDLHQLRKSNPRLVATLAFSPALRTRFDGGGESGAQYWTNNNFWFADEINHTFQADSWLAPIDKFAGAFGVTTPLDFPVDRPAARKIAGLTADKIRFFARAHGAPSEEELGRLMSSPVFEGDLLFALPADSSRRDPALEPWTGTYPLWADETRPVPYEVTQFDSNNLTVAVVNPEPAPLWMSYADVWHPSWRATINGQPVPVYQADLAYKAVRLAPGTNIVHFHFGSRIVSMLWAIVSLNAALWLGAVVTMMWRVTTMCAPSDWS